MIPLQTRKIKKKNSDIPVVEFDICNGKWFVNCTNNLWNYHCSWFTNFCGFCWAWMETVAIYLSLIMLYYGEFNTGRECMQHVYSYSSGKFCISNFKRLFPQKNDILLLRYMFTVLYLDIGRRFIYFENSRIRPKMPGIVWNHPQK